MYVLCFSYIFNECISIITLCRCCVEECSNDRIPSKNATDSLSYLEHAFLLSYRTIEIYELLNSNRMLYGSLRSVISAQGGSITLSFRVISTTKTNICACSALKRSVVGDINGRSNSYVNK